MPRMYDHAYFGDAVVPIANANLSIASSAVLYGLSVYTVFHGHRTEDGRILGFRLADHYARLVNSARVTGIDTFEKAWPEKRFLAAIKETVAANDITGDVFVRVTVHVDALVPGTRSRGLPTTLSIFMYEAVPIVPQEGVRLKTSVWRRTPDYCIPSRAKVNGAYVNSVLAKQDAIDSGYDDCVFLDAAGHVCELSAANIFIVRGGALITPGPDSDLLEGINRRTLLELARDMGIPVQERLVDLTELYIADEAFICGTSAFVSHISEVDARRIGDGGTGPLTGRLREAYFRVLHGESHEHAGLVTPLG